jgi:hypothetical protein
MTLRKKYHKYIINTITALLVISLYIGRKLNFSAFWYNERSNDYLDIIIDTRYIFIVIFSLAVFSYVYGIKRWITFFVYVLCFLLSIISLFNSLIFHRIERFFLIIGLILGIYIWRRFVQFEHSKAILICTTAIFGLPVLFDHFFLSEASSVFLIIYLGIIGYFGSKKPTVSKFLVDILLYFLSINVFTMVIQILSGHSVGLSILGEPVLNIQTTKGLATELVLGNQFLRGYGLFPHPNIAGFVGSICLLFFVLYKPNQSRTRRLGQLLTLFTVGASFSRIAWIGSLTVIWHILNQSKISNKIKYFILTLGSLVTLMIFTFRYRLSDVYRFVDIQRYFEAYKQTTVLQKLFGVGLGTYPFYLKNHFPTLEIWQLEPVHNTILLFFIEFGWLSILIVAALLYTLFYMNSDKQEL